VSDPFRDSLVLKETVGRRLTRSPAPNTYSSAEVTSRLNAVQWDFPGYVPDRKTLGIHQLHWYPATFLPAIAGTLIDILAPQERAVIIDPFCGSGTAVLEAWFRNKPAIGIDNNSFAIEIIANSPWCKWSPVRSSRWW
jgi:DNA methylase